MTIYSHHQHPNYWRLNHPRLKSSTIGNQLFISNLTKHSKQQGLEPYPYRRYRMDETHSSSLHCPRRHPLRLLFPFCICCRSLARCHWYPFLLYHAQPWLLEINIWIFATCVCERERERERERGREAYSIENRLDFSVCVWESERDREVEKFILFGFRLWGCWLFCLVSQKVQDGKENKRNSRFILK